MNKTLTWRITAFTLGAVVVAANSLSFILQENESAIITRFGEPVRTPESAGWHAKLPWPIEKVHRIDARLRYDEIRLSETLTRDKRNIIVPLYFAWRITDTQRFLETVQDENQARSKLDAIITSARNSALGQTDYAALFAPATSDQKSQGLEAVEQSILKQAAQEARQLFGISIEGLGALQLNLPEANTESVFRRMRAERKREASRFRAEGKSESEQIRAAADRQSRTLIAKAKRYAEERRGRAEAEAATLYAHAHQQDTDLYVFLRQLQSLRSVVDKNTTLLLDTSAPPFNLLTLPESQPNSILETLHRPTPAPDRSLLEALALEN